MGRMRWIIRCCWVGGSISVVGWISISSFLSSFFSPLLLFEWQVLRGGIYVLYECLLLLISKILRDFAFGCFALAFFSGCNTFTLHIIVMINGYSFVCGIYVLDR